MKTFKYADIAKHVGEEMGVSDWVLVDQDRVNKFADATGDQQWIHVDVERAKRELPTKGTIAHGYLTLSLIPMLAPRSPTSTASAAASITARTRCASPTWCRRARACAQDRNSSAPSPRAPACN